MVDCRKPKGYWTKERCIEEALKHPTLTIFEKNCSGGSRMARKNGWVTECTAHMAYIKNKK